MEKMRAVMVRLVQGILFLFIVFVTMNCVFDASGIRMREEKFHTCSTEISNCGKASEVLFDVDISGNPLFPEITQYKKMYNLWGDKSKTYELYYDNNRSISNIELPEIKGSLLIQTGYYDSTKDTKDFLRIKLLNDVENFYIAYDSPVKAAVPGWLTNGYEPVLDSLNAPYYITSGPYFKLAIWRKKNVPVTGEVVEIPGNLYDCAGCSGVKPSMYVVIIKPKENIDCSKGYDLGRKGFEGCFATLAKAEEGAQRFCEKNYPKYQCRNTFCKSSTPCWDECPGCTIVGHMLKAEPSSFSYGSEIEFNPTKYTSVADITIQNNQFSNRAVNGNLHFEYQHQVHNMKLNSMTLRMDSLATDAGLFQDITVALWKFSDAKCKDTMPLYNQPCTVYEIAQGDLIVGLSAAVNGKGLLFAGTNQNSILITIDHNNRTFSFQGPLHTMVTLDGKDTPLDIFINLTGHFVNFAPKAFGRESTKHVECGMKRNNKILSGNKDPVILDSAGSFDIYDTLPSNPANYEWYEDFGLVTEKLWGKGSKYTLAPYSLGFGVHTFTLLVKDKNGIVDTDTFTIEVADTLPPELTIPNDIIVYQSATEKGPVKLTIGQAWAYDTCAEKVMISNDAPADLVFPPGDTTVTWTADDGRGNITSKAQKVLLITLEEPLLPKIREGMVQLIHSTNKSMNAIEECTTVQKCRPDLKSLTGAVRQLGEFLTTLPVREERESLRQEIIGRLGPISAALSEADAALAGSNENEKRRAELRSAAMNSLLQARKSMLEITDFAR